MTIDPGKEEWTTRRRTYVLLRTPEDRGILADWNLTAEEVGAHVSDYESLVLPCLRLQRLGKARPFSPVDSFVRTKATSR